MKKEYYINLDVEKVEALDRWLDAAGVSRSAYINSLVVKTVEAMELEKIVDYSKVSILEIFNMVGGVAKIMKKK